MLLTYFRILESCTYTLSVYLVDYIPDLLLVYRNL